MSECSICGQELLSSPLAGPAHARKHKRTYIDAVGERPSTYDAVRQWFAAHEDAQTTLCDYRRGDLQ